MLKIFTFLCAVISFSIGLADYLDYKPQWLLTILSRDDVWAEVKSQAQTKCDNWSDWCDDGWSGSNLKAHGQAIRQQPQFDNWNDDSLNNDNWNRW